MYNKNVQRSIKQIFPWFFFLMLVHASIFISSGCSAQAPKLNFKHISYDKGLSNMAIECIVQDHRGYMWFGTRDGLNRYDGKEIRVFRSVKNDSGSLSDNYITFVFVDHEKKLWVGTQDGLNRYDDVTNRFKRYQHSPLDEHSLSDNRVTCVYEDPGNNLWISTYGGISLFDRSTGQFKSFSLNYRNADVVQKEVCSIAQENENHLWLATPHGLIDFDTKALTFKKPSPSERIGNVYIRFLLKNKGKLWLGTQNSGLLIYDSASDKLNTYRHEKNDDCSLSNDMIASMMIDQEGTPWIGTINGGLNLFNVGKQTFYHYQDEPEPSEGLSKRTITALFEDNGGNYWVGTHRGGLNLFSPNGYKFKLHRKKNLENSLSYNDVNAFCEDSSGNIWIGTDGGGLNLYDRKKNTFRYYRYDPADTHTLGADEILNIMEDSRSNIWVSTWNGGLNLLDKKTGRFTRFLNNPSDSTTISSNYVQKSFEDSHGNFWVATYYGGLNRLNPKTKTFSRVLMDPSRQTSFSGNNVVSIAEDRNSHVWFGTDDGGLNCYDLKTNHFSHYFNENQKKGDLRVIFTDSKGRLWIGQEGLYLFDPVKNTFDLYKEAAGLSTAFIKGMAEDSIHHFWISTSKGLFEFNPATRAYKKYNTSDGLQGLEFDNNSFLKTKDGEMFFGGTNGFNSFHPDQIRVNKFIPPVYITELDIFNKRIFPGDESGILKNDISLTNDLSLSYNQSSIAFNFAALSYTNSENNQYAYRLEGFEKDWHYSNNENKANYTNLDPGEYFFHVKASNNDGIWNEKGTSVRILINPPFWKTSWFLLLVLLLIIGGVYSFYRFKRKMHLKQMEEKKREEILRMQLQFFTNISHEFRTPLTLILGPAERLLKEDSRPAFQNFYHSIFRNANRLFCLINELMDFRKLEEGALRLQVTPGHLNLFLKEVSEEFYGWGADKSIRFEVNMNNSQPDLWFDRQIMEKIVLNLLSNSFKYTFTGGSITLEVLNSLSGFKPSFANEMILLNEYRANKYVYIRVADNGIGISKESIKHLFERYYRIAESHLGSGIGLAFVKSLTFLHKGDIYVYSERYKGTEIIIGIPSEELNYNPQEKWTNQKTEGHISLESIHNMYEKEFPLPEMPESKSELQKKETRQKHILITEDNHELRNFLKDCLSPYYSVSEAVDGNMGLLKAKAETPDLIISDVMMPGMNGNDFCKSIKQHVDTSHIAFMMLTAKGAEPSMLEGVSAGADFYFSKPLSIELLLMTLRNIFDHKQKLKEHYTKSYNIDTKDLTNSSLDKKFMDNLLQIVDDQLISPDLDIDYLCRHMNMSRSKLYEKIKAITGQPTGDFIRTLRLKKAVEIMVHEDVSIMEIACRIGIQTQSYFTKAFKKQYGKTPTQFMQELDRNKQ